MDTSLRNPSIAFFLLLIVWIVFGGIDVPIWLKLVYLLVILSVQVYLVVVIVIRHFGKDR